MKQLHQIGFLCLGGLLLWAAACGKKGSDAAGKAPEPVRFEVPKGWPAPVYDFASNPLTKEGIALGRKLFYDGILSKDGNFPCGSCHQQVAAFATFDHTLSHGFNGQFTTRNAQALQNLAWMKEFHHDGGINHLDVQPIAPITAANEMAETLENVLKKLEADAEYRQLFMAAFGQEKPTTALMNKALSQFMLTMVSAESKYDKVKRGEVTFSLSESVGYQIFKEKKCDNCHTEPFFTDFSYRNNGLPLEPVLRDAGRMLITRNPADSLKFKVPSLRNVLLSFPYMHDGRIKDIYEVLEHYNARVVNGPTTDPLVKNKIPLSNFEKGQIVAFLATLTDQAFISNTSLAQP